MIYKKKSHRFILNYFKLGSLAHNNDTEKKYIKLKFKLKLRRSFYDSSFIKYYHLNYLQ